MLPEINENSFLHGSQQTRKCSKVLTEKYADNIVLIQARKAAYVRREVLMRGCPNIWGAVAAGRAGVGPRMGTPALRGFVVSLWKFLGRTT